VNRLFFAIWPDAGSVERLRATAEALAPRVGGRPVPRDNLHVTLAFLGDLDDARAAAAAAVPLESTAFALALDRLGSFRRARVAWAGCTRAPPALLELESRLSARLRAEGFALEERPFTPHVTLLRKIERALPAEAVEVIGWEVKEVTLVQSRAGRYGIVKRWVLD